jgi:hypothetical protein
MAQMKKTCVAVDGGERLMSRWAPVFTLVFNQQSDKGEHFKISVASGAWCSGVRCRTHRERMNKYAIYSWGDELKGALRTYAESIVETQFVYEFVNANKHSPVSVKGCTFMVEYKQSRKELQRCDHWISQLEKIQSIDLLADELVGALTGSLPERQDAYQFKGIIDPAIFTFLWDCGTVSTVTHHCLGCESCPEWDGVWIRRGFFGFF